ncbi:MAG: MATE family efflux transporter [Eubacteriales bacterium]|nr:MATE family efflux transporter [Eubacteriales bacterium]
MAIEESKKENKHMVNMTAGPILPILVSFALPLMLGSLFQDLYNLADMTIAGYTIGDGALAAISATSGIVSFIMATSRGYNIGNAISVSNSFGGGDIEKTRRNLAGMFTLCYVLSISMTLLLVIGIKPLMRLINTPENLFDDAYRYVIIIILGLSFTMTYDLFACSFRALGNSKLPLVLLIICSVLNIFLDLLFMYVLRMGVMGAALATIIAQLISAVAAAVFFYRLYPELRFRREDFKTVGIVAKDMFPLGIMGALTNSMYAIGWIFMQSGINSLGQNTLVAYAAYKKIDMFAVIPSVAIANTLSTFAAQNFGAKQFKRITKGIFNGIGLSLAINVVTFTIISLVGQPLIRLITNTKSDEVVLQAYTLLRITVAFIWWQTTIMGFRFSIQGMRKKLIPFLGTFFELIIRTVFALCFIPLIGYTAIAWAEAACWVLGGIMMIICYFIIHGKEKRMYETQATSV